MIQEVSDIDRAQDLTVVFLAETWLDEARLIGIQYSLKFGHHQGVPKITHGDGLALFWKRDFDLQVISISKNHIDALINRGKDNIWRFTGFYGNRLLISK